MAEKGKRPNILLLVADTVRPDHLSCYGYRRKTSPTIDKLASQGAQFENTFAPAEWSPPSHASIFTGLYPSYHRTMGRHISLNKENITLAEVLSRNGYKTIGVSSNGLISAMTGFSKGFDEFFDLTVPYRSFEFLRQSPRDAIRTLIYGLDWFTYRNIEKIKNVLKKHNSDRPFFLFTNIFCCHAPHDPPRPFKRIFCSSLREPRIYLAEFLLSKLCGHTGETMCCSNLDVRRLNLLACDDGQYYFMANEFEVAQEEWEVVKSWYDGAISYLDFRIEELISFLDQKEMLEDTMLVILSDHGENFGEHGLASHQFCLYDSLLRVPLIMVYPDAIPKGKRISNIVSLVDVFPTILDMARIEGFGDRIQGKSLFPFEDKKVHDYIFAEAGETLRNPPPQLSTIRKRLDQIDKAAKCVRTEDYKYILYQDGRQELYHIGEDPFEKVNIVSQNSDVAEHLKERVENGLDLTYFGPLKWKRESKEMEERLRSLGYF